MVPMENTAAGSCLLNGRIARSGETDGRRKLDSAEEEEEEGEVKDMTSITTGNERSVGGTGSKYLPAAGLIKTPDFIIKRITTCQDNAGGPEGER